MMNKWANNLFIFLLFFIPFVSYAEVVPANFIKVTPQSDPACVEYRSVNNEMYCSTKLIIPPSNPNLAQNEHQNIVFDERRWVAASGQRTPYLDYVEYVPAGVNIASWNELVTSQFMPDPENKISPRSYVENYLQILKKPGFSLITQTLKNTPSEIIFEFRIVSPPNQVQDELQRVIRGPQGLYMVRYTIKKADMGQENRDKWVGILQKSTPK